MNRLTSIAALFAACVLAGRPASANVPSCAYSTLPCAIVLVGHDVAGTSADPYGEFAVVLKDDLLTPLPGFVVNVDFGGCCPGIKLSNTQLGASVTHVANSSVVSAITDVTGTARFRVEGAAAGGGSMLTGATGCATITVKIQGFPWGELVLTDGICHPTVMVAAPDLAGLMGTPGVDITDLSFFISDKSAYVASTANYRQRSDFDYHLPVFNCSTVFNPSTGFGVNLGDLAQWIAIKNSARSYSNGPFPVSCP